MSTDSVEQCRKRQARRRGFKKHLGFFLNCMATIQVVWFYLSRVPSALDLSLFENGLERRPFQQRLIMMIPMRQAHQSPFLQAMVNRLSGWPGWFSASIHPESIVEFLIDLLCIAFTGFVAQRIYQAASRKKLLSPFVYPVVLLMIATTYSLSTIHSLRFIYDLPALAFFSTGLYLIFFGRHPLLFSAVFVVATLNRETTLLLLLAYALKQCMPDEPLNSSESDWHVYLTKPSWSKLCSLQTLAVLAPLVCFWIAWHLWSNARFAANASASGPRFLLNLGIIACPFSWPQLTSCFSYLLPLILLHRKHILNPILRTWLLLLPVMLVLMLCYGLVIETRIFGELIAFLGCTAVLIAEELFLTRSTNLEQLTFDSNYCHGGGSQPLC